jgi:hypothetical protein
MKKLLFFVLPTVMAICSCTTNKDVYDPEAADQIENANSIPNVSIGEVSNFKMTKEYNVPTIAGKVTVMIKGNDTLAVTDHAITVNIPKTSSVVVNNYAKARGTREKVDSATSADVNKIMVNYVDADSLTDYKPNSSMVKEETIMMFEDSPVNCDYDYNDVVLLVKCKTFKNADNSKLVYVAVKPLAYGAQNNIKFGFDYQADDVTTLGNTTTTNSATGIILSNNVKRDFFGNKCINTTGTYSPVIPTKAYTLSKPFNPVINYLGDDSTIACVKYDRKSRERKIQKDLLDGTSVDTVIVDTFDNEGFYQFAPISFTSADNFDEKNIKFFIAPEIPLTYTKTSTYTINGQTLSGKIKYTSIFTYKLYAGDCNLKSSTLIPYGIAIPVTQFGGSGYVYWPYEGQPIWEGFPRFKDWLTDENDSTWIKTPNPSDSFDVNGQSWNATLLVRGASAQELILSDSVDYCKDVLDLIDAAKKSTKTNKVEEQITDAEQAY